MSLIQQIRDALTQSGGMTAVQLADALGIELKRVRDTCNEARGRGALSSTRESDGIVFTVAPDAPPLRALAKQAVKDSSETPTSAPAKKPKIAQSRKSATLTPAVRKRDFLVACETSEKMLKALQFSATTADDALQVYVHSVVDVAIYGPLKAAADQARAALNAFVTSTGEIS